MEFFLLIEKLSYLCYIWFEFRISFRNQLKGNQVRVLNSPAAVSSI